MVTLLLTTPLEISALGEHLAVSLETVLNNALVAGIIVGHLMLEVGCRSLASSSGI